MTVRLYPFLKGFNSLLPSDIQVRWASGLPQAKTDPVA